MNEAIKEYVTTTTSEQLFAVWFLIGAALVFWMQAGFAMVEAGFTRAKNTGNIIMKNLMDFCIGTVSARPLLPSFRALWQSAPSSFPTAYIPA